MSTEKLEDYLRLINAALTVISKLHTFKPWLKKWLEKQYNNWKNRKN